MKKNIDWANSRHYDTSLRHAQKFACLLHETDKLYLQGGKSIEQGEIKFKGEWENIQMGQLWAAKNMSHDMAAASCLLLKGHYIGLNRPLHEGMEWLEHVLAAAQILKDRKAESEALNSLGACYLTLNEELRAIECHKRSLEIAREIRDRRIEGDALGALGMVYHRNDVYQAIQLYNHRVIIAREVNDKRGEANGLGNLGTAFTSLGNLNDAREHFYKGLKIAQETGYLVKEGEILNNLGIIYSYLGEPYRSFEYYQQSLLTKRKVNSERKNGLTLWSMAMDLEKLGFQSLAIAYAEAALEMFEEYGHPLSINVSQVLAQWYGQTGKKIFSLASFFRAFLLSLSGSLAVASGFLIIIILTKVATQRGQIPIFLSGNAIIFNGTPIINLSLFTIYLTVVGFGVLGVCFSRISSKRIDGWQAALLAWLPFLIGHRVITSLSTIHWWQNSYIPIAFTLIIACLGGVFGLLLPQKRAALSLFLVSPVVFHTSLILSWLWFAVSSSSHLATLGSNIYTIDPSFVSSMTMNEPIRWSVTWLLYGITMGITIWQIDQVALVELLKQYAGELNIPLTEKKQVTGTKLILECEICNRPMQKLGEGRGVVSIHRDEKVIGIGVAEQCWECYRVYCDRCYPSRPQNSCICDKGKNSIRDIEGVTFIGSLKLIKVQYLPFRKGSRLDSLHMAVSVGNITRVQQILEQGININTPEPTEGQTPLHVAIRHLGKTDNSLCINMVNLLLKFGADVNAVDDDGITALHWAAAYGLTMVARILINAGANVNTKDKFSITPLHQCVEHPQLEIPSILIEAGADLNVRNVNGQTPLTIAEGQLVFPDNIYKDLKHLLKKHGAVH